MFLISNTGLSRLGTSAFSAIVLWVTLALTNSPMLTGLVDGTTSLPLFLSFIVGSYIDQSRKKRALAISSSIIRPLSIAIAILALVSGNLFAIIASLFFTAFMIGFTSDVLNSIRSSWTKMILSEEEFKRGTSLLETSGSIAIAVGSGVSGVMLLFGFPEAFGLLILIFVAALLPVFFIKTKEDSQVQSSGERKSTKESMLEGLSFIRNTRPVVQMIVLTLFANFLFGTTGVILTALVQKIFELPASYFGALFAVLSVAMIIGSLISSKVRGTVGRLASITFLVIGASLAAIAVSRSIYLDFALMFAIGLMIGIINVIAGTAFLKMVPGDMIARVMGSLNTFALGITFVSGAIGGTLIFLTSVTDALIIVGALTCCIALLSVTFRALNELKV